MLKSKYIDDFFGISDRIKTISAQLEEMSKKVQWSPLEEENPFTGVVPLAPGVEEEMGNDAKEEEIAAAKKAEVKQAAQARPLQIDEVCPEKYKNICTLSVMVKCIDVRALSCCEWYYPNVICWYMLRGETIYTFDAHLIM